jgi:hypothetical protein
MTPLGHRRTSERNDRYAVLSAHSDVDVGRERSVALNVADDALCIEGPLASVVIARIPTTVAAPSTMMRFILRLRAFVVQVQPPFPFPGRGNRIGATRPDPTEAEGVSRVGKIKP